MRSPSAALARRALADSRTRTLSFALLFAVLAYVQVAGYRNSFPTTADRVSFARSFGDNKAIRLFYGTPHDLLSTGGYVAWRVGGTLSIFAALWGMLGAVRALRTEEEAGRAELVLAGIVTRRDAFGAVVLALGLGVAMLWAALLAGLLIGPLPAGPSAYLAVATVSPAVVLAAASAVVCQLAPTRRLAVEAGTGLVGLALLLRVVADTVSSAGWLRWLTPLGWAEEARAFTGARPAVLLLPLAATVLLLGIASAMALRRDVGTGMVTAADSAAPNLRLLSSPTAHALRSERGSLLAWLGGVGFFAVVFGLIADSFSSAKLSEGLKRQLEQVGGASILSPEGALSFYFLFFMLAIALFMCAQVGAVRREESEERLETLLALCVGRRAWLLGRLALAVGGAAAIALTAGVLAWAGAASQGADVSLPHMLEAGANCLPAALLFLGIAALAYAALPRAASTIAYISVSATFVWQLVGELLGAPGWTLALSPFHDVGMVPAQSFKAVEAAVMLALAAATCAAALRAFERRDLTGA